MAIMSKKLLLLAVGAAAVVALVLYLRHDGSAPSTGRVLTAAELEAILAQPTAPAAVSAKPGAAVTPPQPGGPGMEGDVRLLAHLRSRSGGPNGWRNFPAGLRDLYITLRVEEIARTDGFIAGLAGNERDLGDVEPDEAAMAYDVLGAVAAGDLMRKLDAIVQRDGAAWRASVRPVAGAPRAASPDPRELNQLGQAFAQQVPAIRSARLAWIREHTADVLGR